MTLNLAKKILKSQVPQKGLLLAGGYCKEVWESTSEKEYLKEMEAKCKQSEGNAAEE